MNHSGNERLSSGSPQAGVLTKDFASNIWYTLYFSTGRVCWNTAHVMECFTESYTGGKKVFALHVRKWTVGHYTTQTCTVMQWSGPGWIFSPSVIREFMFSCVIKKSNKIIRGGGGVTTLRQPLRNSLPDKVHCIYLCLLLFFCLDSIKSCTEAITALLAPTCWYKILIGHYHLKRAIKAE